MLKPLINRIGNANLNPELPYRVHQFELSHLFQTIVVMVKEQSLVWAKKRPKPHNITSMAHYDQGWQWPTSLN